MMRPIIHFIGFSLSVLTAWLFVGCDAGGGAGLGGGGTIRGIVVSFETPSGNLDGGVGGVRVGVDGTDLAATTSEEGFFIISGVPEGDVALSFSLDGASGRLSVSVPKGGEATLNNVRIRDDRVEADSVVITVPPGDDDSPGDDDDDDGDDDSSERSDSSAASSGDDSGDDSPDDSEDEPEHEDDGDDDSPDHPAEDEVEVKGPIQAVSGSSITVKDRTFIINGSTEIRDDNENPITTNELVVGLRAEVEGEVKNGVLVAEKIELDD